MNHTTKRDLKYTAAGLPMFAAMLVASGEPAADCTAATYWTIEGICFSVIIACALILRKIYLSTK